MTLATATLAALLRTCAPAVSADTMRAIVAVESHGYSYAINDNTTRTAYCVPGAPLYPCTRAQANTIAVNASARGHSVDVGLAQVNSYNFRSYRVTAAQMLTPCPNLHIGSEILANTYRMASSRFPDQRQALRHAIMAYNSGSLYAGDTYVRAVVAAALTRSDTYTVPSITLLQTAESQRRLPFSRIDTERTRLTQGVPLRPLKPNASPLIARLLPANMRGDLANTLEPATLTVRNW